MPESALITAFLVGLLGGVHCLGMCGGIVAALSLGVDKSLNERGGFRLWSLQAGYNLGRIASYTFMGAIVGGLGMMVADVAGLQQVRVVLQYLAIAVMVALGLYLAGWWYGLSRLEQAGSHIWKRIEPLGRKLIPVKTPTTALMLGLIWGWLPCGLVYSVLLWALTAGDPVNGALYMLAFGLGTLPNLLLMGGFATQLSRYSQNPLVRRTAGLLIIGLALFQLSQVMGVTGAA